MAYGITLRNIKRPEENQLGFRSHNPYEYRPVTGLRIICQVRIRHYAVILYKSISFRIMGVHHYARRYSIISRQTFEQDICTVKKFAGIKRNYPTLFNTSGNLRIIGQTDCKTKRTIVKNLICLEAIGIDYIRRDRSRLRPVSSKSIQEITYTLFFSS